jgi:SPP1 gp7 family putative phage head morphogenesis protein
MTKAAGFNLPRRIEMAYQSAIRRLILPAFHPKPPEQSYEDWLAEVARISERRDIADAAAFIAGRMCAWVNVQNQRTWREAAARSTRSRMLHQLLQRELQGPVGELFRQLVKDNAQYITRIPREISEHLTEHIAKAQQAGTRPETIAKFMRERFPAMTKSRIRLIARTETQKASAALTHARADDLNIPFLIWETSQDARVRKSHRNLQGVLMQFADPPQPEQLIGERSTLGHGLPGEFPNCRCYAHVVLTMEDISWPAKMYANGRLFRITRAEFKRRFNLEEREAA